MRKTQYFHRVTDGVYVIYKIGPHVRNIIQIMYAGPAYAKGGHYSKEFTDRCEEVGIEPRAEDALWATANSYADFMGRLYIQYHYKQLQFTDAVVDVLLPYFYTRSEVLGKKIKDLQKEKEIYDKVSV